MVQCPICRRTEVARSRRTGVVDEVFRWLGRWPYRCRACTRQFHHKCRYAPLLVPEPVQPVAHITVRATTHEQLDTILLAMNQAIAAHQPQHATQLAHKT